MAKIIKQRSMRRAWMPVVVWAACILVFSGVPIKGSLVETSYQFDKIVHFMEYGILALLIMRALLYVRRSSFVKNIVFTLILSVGYGIVIELMQLFIPGRGACPYDVLSNIAGIICGILIGVVIL